MTADPGASLAWSADLHAEPTVTGSVPTTLAAQLADLVRDTCEDQRLPGLLAEVADTAGASLWQWRSGIAGINPLRKVEPSVALRVGSISKTMTAVLVLQLVDEGRICLDDDVNAHLRSFRVAGPADEIVTVRQLLTHTSGLATQSDIELACAPGDEPTVASFYRSGLVGTVPPGASFAYSNPGFAALGQLVEDVVGTPLAEHARSSLFDRLGMRSTSYIRDPRVVGPLFEGFELTGTHLSPTPLQSIVPLGAGSVWSTAEDMARYGAFMHGRGANQYGRALSPPAFAELVRPQTYVTGLPSRRWAGKIAMCLGWLELCIGSTRAWWHNGGWPGAKSELAVLPDLGLTVLLFSNCPIEIDLDTPCARIVEALSDHVRVRARG